MIMVRYSTSGYRLFDPETNKVVDARNIIFNERLKNEIEYFPSNEKTIHAVTTEQQKIEQNSEEEKFKERENQVSEEHSEGRGKKKFCKPKWPNRVQ